MKTLHLLIIVILVASSIIVSQSAFAQQTAKEILQERDNAKKTGLAYNGTMLVVTQQIDKTEYKTGEKFSVIPYLQNVGNNVATIIHGEPLFEIKVLDQNGNTSFIWGDTIATIAITETLSPSTSTTGRWVSGDGGFPEIALDKPGNYTVYSIAGINSEGIPAHTESIWSQPLDITILPANYTSQVNSTNSIPQNAIRTPNGGWITPLQTTNNSDGKLNLHVEGVDVSGKIMPSPVTENMESPKQLQTPLQQFKSGIESKDVKCGQNLQLIIKAGDGSPACVKPDTAQKLIERGWVKEIVTTNQTSLSQNSNSSCTLSHPITDLANDAGIVTIGNRTYYFETPIYSHDAYLNPPQISFHNVTFTLFPAGFRGGLPIPCNLQGTYQYYWTDAKFADITHELLHIQTATPPCPTNLIPAMFSIHTNPQAGLIFYDGKMKILASVEEK